MFIKVSGRTQDPKPGSDAWQGLGEKGVHTVSGDSAAADVVADGVFLGLKRTWLRLLTEVSREDALGRFWGRGAKSEGPEEMHA